MAWVWAIPICAAYGGQAAPEPLTGFTVPEGWEATLWAESPKIFNPTNIDVDARGRIWVAEGVNYRMFNEANHPTDELPRPEGDRIVILEDTDGDGMCDSSKVFVQDSELVAPVGIYVLGNRVFVSCSPHLFLFTDEDGDDRADKKEVFLTGFGGHDHDHSLHALVGGPDGKLYFNVGNAGPHKVTDRGGWTLRSGSHYNGGVGLESDDGRVWVGGLVLRMNPDGTGLEVLSDNMRNCYEVAVDSFGNVWGSDNDDEVMACRASWMMEGSDQGFASADGSRSWSVDKRPGQTTPIAHWRQQDPGVIPVGDHMGPGSPTGSVFYEETALPARGEFGLLLDADAGRNVIYGHVPRASGAGFFLDRSAVFSSLPELPEDYVWSQVPEDERKLFRPSDVALGLDGALYVADWYDPIVGGHRMMEQQGYGRIFRVAPKNAKTAAPAIDLTTLEGQIEALRSPAINVRFQAAQRIRAHGAEAVPALKSLFEKTEAPNLRARYLWLLADAGDEGLVLVEEALTDPNPTIRLTAYRALRKNGSDFLKYAETLATDPSPLVRADVALSLRDASWEECADVLLTLAEGFDGHDRWYLDALGIGFDGKIDAAYPELLASLGGLPLSWSPTFAGLAWRLHPVSSVEAHRLRAFSDSLPYEERRRSMTALAFIPHERAARAMADLSVDGPEDLREEAGWWIQSRFTNDWKDFSLERQGPEVSEKNSAEEEAAKKMLLSLREKILDPATAAEEKEDAARILAGSEAGGTLLVGLAERERLDRSLYAAIGESIFRNPDYSVRALASKHFPRPGGEGAPLVIEEIAKLEGCHLSGKELFFDGKAGCASCHSHGGQGGQTGPDLTQIHTKYDLTGLLDSILNPSAAIAAGFEAWTIETIEGEILSGFILADGDWVVFRDASGDQHLIAREDIVYRKKQESSLMPDNAALGLGARELADLSAFLLMNRERACVVVPGESQ